MNELGEKMEEYKNVAAVSPRGNHLEASETKHSFKNAINDSFVARGLGSEFHRIYVMSYKHTYILYVIHLQNIWHPRRKINSAL